MHKIIEERVNYLLQKIETVKQTEEDLLIAMEVLPSAKFWVDPEVNAYWTPKSMDEVKAALKAFAKRGMLLAKFNPHVTYPSWTIQGKKATITLTPHWAYEEDDGVSCRLVQVGVDTVVNPVYKLVCDEKTND